MIKGVQKNPYKCMNVMKQYVMNDKIKERCKTCEKQISQQRFLKHMDIKNTRTH